jgi:response regulator RpfG family c-di-GMP phosphodiesterase
MTHQPTIAVIDDDADFQNLMEQVLADQGYRVIGFPVGEGADEVVQATHADLVILDIRLPGVSGFHVLNRLLTNPATTHVPVMVCTGMAWGPAVQAQLTAMGVHVLQAVRPGRSAGGNSDAADRTRRGRAGQPG